jgi:nucleoside-diphosphate-sugar epimerase
MTTSPDPATRTVLVIGASGYLGEAVVDRLLAGGDRVIALRRPGSSGALDPRVEVRTGDLADLTSLAGAVDTDVDAVVHLAPPTGDEALDTAALQALLARLHGSGRALLYVSGVWVLGPSRGRLLDETSPTDPVAAVAYRPALERLVLDAAAEGVHAVVLRPGVVHGRGGGIPALLVDLARSHGIGLHVEDPGSDGRGGVRWPMVHVDDLADLVALALTSPAAAGQVLHAVAEQGVDIRDLAAAAADAAGVGGTREWPVAEARAVLGEAFADALALDQQVDAGRTRALLGWQPSRPGAREDIAEGSYRAPASVSGS